MVSLQQAVWQVEAKKQEQRLYQLRTRYTPAVAPRAKYNLVLDELRSQKIKGMERDWHRVYKKIKKTSIYKLTETYWRGERQGWTRGDNEGLYTIDFKVYYTEIQDLINQVHWSDEQFLQGVTLDIN